MRKPSKILNFKFIVISLLLFFNINVSYSQYNPIEKSAFQDTVKVDSVEAEKLGLFNKENKNTFKILFSGKPALAGLYSLILPGAGQAYNRQYWKIPIAWGLVGYFGYNAYFYTQKYKEYKAMYNIMEKCPTCTFGSLKQLSQVKAIKNQYRNYSENQWVTFGLIYFLQVLDAYISRHLIDFDLNNSLSLIPISTHNYFGLVLNFNMNEEKSKNSQKKPSFF